jgi:hypothetical protein
VDEHNHKLEATLAAIYAKPEDTTTEDKIYDAIAIAYTKELIKTMREEREKYRLLQTKLQEKK